jgi:endonuclease III
MNKAREKAMAREPWSKKSIRAQQILSALRGSFPNAKIELDFTTPLELLVCVLLSAQTTDKRVNLVTPKLFARYRSAADYAAARAEELEPYIQSVGLFRTKAKNLVALGQQLVELYQGEVPTERELLAELPGVGQKTAGVVSMHLGGTSAFPVDTHVMRLAGRMGLSHGATPDDIESDLQKLFAESDWFDGHQLLVWHGRRVCDAKNPRCGACVVTSVCPQRGVVKSARKATATK